MRMVREGARVRHAQRVLRDLLPKDGPQGTAHALAFGRRVPGANGGIPSEILVMAGKGRVGDSESVVASPVERFDLRTIKQEDAFI